MVYQQERLGGILGSLANLALGVVSAEDANRSAQDSAASQESQATTNLYLSRQAKENSKYLPQDTSWQSTTLTMQKYGALAAVGVVLVIGFFVLRK